ncbi:MULTISPECIES: protoporphyrinogen/coproporphyrinogen oxidase [Leptolyngbya]|uniref:protoporphyrinogen/coproporphyrinogen oxidase n=1 Tax=Leptolyngbya TaxID=47251 RepID=UPI001688BAF5|nr:FAD-dependent oxidoreductase [Leptolyngbya sp. FACHB-1624]MBD1857356.1 FAD-dependent oxidoreductase [Leptolyngbya sp. FACHB-1624]
MNTEIKPVVIVGGGLAGLTAAWALRQHNIPVKLYEAGKQIAGLAGSFHDPDGFTYDFGAHFVTNRLAAAIGVGALCRNVRYYGETVYLKGRNYTYPFGLLQNPRYVASGIASKLKRHQPKNAAEWYRAEYGQTLANEVAIPLTEAWSGAAAEDLATSVGDKLQAGIAQSIVHKLMARFTQRAVTNGYSHDMPENPHVWHVYPKGGLGLLCQKLAEDLQDCIQLESPVEAILVENEQAVGVRVKGIEQPASAVISTAPCHILAKLVQGSDAVKPLSSFKYRPMVFVNLRLHGRGLLSDTVVWTPERDYFFFRLTETPLSMPWLAPEGKTLITADIGCEIGDEIWQMSDEELGERCIEHLREIIPDARQRYFGCRVLKTPIAYPVFLSQYEEHRQRLAHSTGISGLYSIGRNGEFAHLLMEDIYWRTTSKMRQLAANLN